MSYTPIPKGTDPWDEQVNNAFTDQDGRITVNEGAIGTLQTENDQQWNEITINRNNIALLRANGGQPQDYNLTSWSNDPGSNAAGSAMPNGLVLMTKLWLNPGTVTYVCLSIDALGTGLVANQSFMGLYDQAGNRLGVTADQSTAFASLGFKRVALLTPVVISTAGFYYVASLCNATTPPNLIRGSNATSSATHINMDLPATQYRYATGPAGTSLPTTIDMSARTARVQAYWAAVG